MEIRRGDIVRVDFGTVIGSEQGGQRPAVVVQNDVGNMRAPTCIVLPMTSSSTKASLPTHCRIAPTNNTGLRVESVVLAEQFRTVDKVRIIDKIGSLNALQIAAVDEAIRVSVGLVPVGTGPRRGAYQSQRAVTPFAFAAAI